MEKVPCKLQKEMYPSRRLLSGWDTPLLFITTKQKKLALPGMSYYLSQGRHFTDIGIVRKPSNSFTAQPSFIAGQRFELGPFPTGCEELRVCILLCGKSHLGD